MTSLTPFWLSPLSQVLRGLALVLWSLVILGTSILFARKYAIFALIRRISAASATYLRGHTKATREEEHGTAHFWGPLLVAVLVASWTGWAWLAVHDSRRIHALESELAKYRSETVTEHNVTIISRLPDGDFAFRSDEESRGGAFRPCPVDIVNGVDVVGMLSQGIGYTADYASWEERGVCKSILRADLGFWFRDDKSHFQYTRVNNVGATE